MSLNNRWAIFIDIEGFSHFQDEKDFYLSIDNLLCNLYLIGSKVYPNEPDRLFIHQMGGDGFLIVSSFPEKDLSRPIAIASILLRSIILNGYIGKAGISVGNFADISGCWPKYYELIEKDLPKQEVLGDWYPIEYNRNRIFIGEGIITTISLMGYALLKSYKTQSKGPKGPLLIIDGTLKDMIPEEMIMKNSKDFILVNWIQLENKQISHIAEGLNRKELIDIKLISEKYSEYLKSKSDVVSDIWMSNAKELLRRKDDKEN